MNPEAVERLIMKHGYHNPRDYGREMGLYCHCGTYMPRGMGQYEDHVRRVVRAAFAKEGQ